MERGNAIMSNSKQNQIIKAIDGLESQLEYVKGLIHDAIPPKEWIDTKEFASRANLQHRTITNYVGKGFFERFQRLDNGHYLIHISELQKWGK